ncbi:MAG: iron-sulfur cluster assembly protein [Verrucomicrobiota bacterium]
MSLTGQTIKLKKDVVAIQIPEGNKVPLDQGTSIVVTQSLGGNFTVHIELQGGLYRINAEDADALGVEIEKKQEEKKVGSLEDQVWTALKTCYDPEIPVNIVDLGLIYSLELNGVDGTDSKSVHVKMTLTAPGCGMGPSIAADAKSKIDVINGISESEVELVWEPTWEPSMISEEGKKKLGIES